MFQGFTQDSLSRLNGTFLLQNYSPKEYNGNPQIFDIVQDSRGIMYFSNQKGIIEYDGTKWSTIQIGQEDLKCLSLAKEENGLIYAGANGDFGVLKPDVSGRLQFVSEIKQLGIDSVGRVAKIIIQDSSIKYLKTEKALFVIATEGVEVIKPKTEIDDIFLLDNKLYVLQKGLGLFFLKGKELKKVEDGEQFSTRAVVASVRFGGRNLFFTDQDGVYEVVTKKEDGELQLVKRNIFNGMSLLSAIKIDDDLLSLGTSSNGIIVVDQKFNVVYSVGIEKGIIDAAIKAQFIDKEKNLWLGTNVGISKIEITSPVLKFDLSSGLQGTVEGLARFNSRIYVASQNGPYRMNDNGFFENIAGIEKDCYGLQVFPNGNDTLLLIAEVQDVISLDKKNEKFNLQPGGPWEIQLSPLNPNEVIIVHYDGLANLVYENGEFVTGELFQKIHSR